MLSDSLHETLIVATSEIANYAMSDYSYMYEEGNSGPLFYDESTYQRAIESLIPVIDAQIMLDVGCDLCEIAPESAYLVPDARNRLLGRLYEMILNQMVESAS